MKFGISYNRKVRTRAYEMLEIGLYMEFDTGNMDLDRAFETVRLKVERWIVEERDRIMREYHGEVDEKDSEMEEG